MGTLVQMQIDPCLFVSHSSRRHHLFRDSPPQPPGYLHIYVYPTPPIRQCQFLFEPISGLASSE